MKSLVILALLLLVACESSRHHQIRLPSGEALSLPYGETLSTVIASEPPKMDWLTSSDTDSSWIQEQIMEGLVRFDLTQPGLKLQPALATHWEMDQQGRRWTFFLRQGVKWSDGVEFTSQHVVDAFHRILKPETAAIAVDNIFPIKNAKAFNQGRVKDIAAVGITARGPYQVSFELEQPMVFFPLLLTHHTTFPVRLDVIEKHQEIWTEPENIVTLGPYRLIYWHHDSRLVLQRNETYWGKKPRIKYVVYYMISKPATALRMFERGRIDLIRDLPSSEIPRLRKRPEFHFLPGLRLYYYGLKIKKKPFDNPKVRKAIALAIDRKQVTDILGGGQQPLKSWVPPGMFGFDPEVGLDWNPAQGKQLLIEAGYLNPQDLPTLVLGFNTDEKHKRVAENIQAQLKKNLGIRVELRNEEWKTFLSGVRSDNGVYNWFRLGWVADYADPHNFLAIMTSFSVNNRTGWKNLKYDELVKQGLQEVDPQKRLQIYHKAQKIMLEEDVAVIPLLNDVNQVLVSQRVVDYHNNVLDLYHFFTMGLR